MLESNHFVKAMIMEEIEKVETLHEQCRKQIVNYELQEKALKLLLKDLKVQLEKLSKL